MRITGIALNQITAPRLTAVSADLHTVVGSSPNHVGVTWLYCHCYRSTAGFTSSCQFPFGSTISTDVNRHWSTVRPTSLHATYGCCVGNILIIRRKDYGCEQVCAHIRLFHSSHHNITRIDRVPIGTTVCGPLHRALKNTVDR